MDSIYRNIDSLYDKAGYLQRYGTDLYITILLVILFFIAISYYQVMTKIQPIRSDWIRQRCNPSVIPFAGLIYRPKGKTVMEATGDNLVQCSQTTLQNVSGYALQPFVYIVSVMNDMFAEMRNAVDSVRAKFNEVRTTVDDLGQDVMGRSLNVLTPIQQLLVSTKDAFGKASGIGAASIYSLYGAYLGLKSFIGSIIEFIIVILIGLAAVVVILWILPFTWPIAAIGTAAFIAVAIVLAYVVVVFSQSMHGSSGSIPSSPGCLDENTEIVFDSGDVKRMKDITPNDFGRRLSCGSTLLGLVESSARGHDVFCFNGITATGCHRVILKDENGNDTYRSLESLCLTPIAYDKPIVYCPITSSGHFFVGGHKFTDWLDLTDSEVYQVAKWFDVEESRYSVFKTVCAGLDPKTLVKTDIGVSIPIDIVKLHVPLTSNVIPLAKVRMLAPTRWSEILFVNGSKLVKSGNLEWVSLTEEFGVTTHSRIEPNIVCNLVTNTGYFFVGNCRVSHFDHTLDDALNMEQTPTHC